MQQQTTSEDKWDDAKYCRPIFAHEYADKSILETVVSQLCFRLGINPTPKTLKGLKRIILDLFVRYKTTSGLRTLSVFTSNGSLTEAGSDQYRILGFTGSKVSEIVKALVSLSYIEYSPGYSYSAPSTGLIPKARGRSSVIRATASFIEWLEQSGITWADMERHERYPLLYSHTFTGSDGKTSKRRIELSDQYSQAAGFSTINSYNQLIRHCDLRVGTKRLHPFETQVCRIFQDETATTNGRIYGGIWMHLPSKARSHILINGSPIVEVDIKSAHPTIAYGLSGYDITEIRKLEGDPYSVDGMDSDCSYTRELLKKLMLMLSNSKSIASASRALNDYANEYIDPLTGELELKRVLNRYKLQKLSVQEMILKLRRKHYRINSYFLNESWKTLNIYESNIAVRVLEHFTSKGIPVLTVHDSFLVQSQYRDELTEVLTQAISDELRIVFKYPDGLVDVKGKTDTYSSRDAEVALDTVRQSDSLSLNTQQLQSTTNSELFIDY